MQQRIFHLTVSNVQLKTLKVTTTTPKKTSSTMFSLPPSDFLGIKCHVNSNFSHQTNVHHYHRQITKQKSYFEQVTLYVKSLEEHSLPFKDDQYVTFHWNRCQAVNRPSFILAIWFTQQKGFSVLTSCSRQNEISALTLPLSIQMADRFISKQNCLFSSFS